ncbi:MAG: hypothetical protein II917_03685 [Synergistaceae bacterium]|nr:hypothetical protein [Synergistaceae bacterium]
MAVKTLRLKLKENELADVRQVASVFHMSVNRVFREALKNYVDTKKQTPLYRLTANIEEASPEESAEILAMIENMTDDDWKTVRVDHFTITY